MKKMFKGISVLLLLTMVMLTKPVTMLAKQMPAQEVIAEEKGTYSAAAGGSHVESCWVCNVGEIYMTMESERCFDGSVLCQHGFARGTDSVYKIYTIYRYRCEECGYGWNEYPTQYRLEVKCEGYNEEKID